MLLNGNGYGWECGTGRRTSAAGLSSRSRSSSSGTTATDQNRMGDRFHGMARRAEGSGLNRGARFGAPIPRSPPCDKGDNGSSPWPGDRGFESISLQRGVIQNPIIPTDLDGQDAMGASQADRGKIWPRGFRRGGRGDRIWASATPITPAVASSAMAMTARFIDTLTQVLPPGLLPRHGPSAQP
jgi:hypothetical protein